MKRFILLYFSLTCLNTLWGTLLADSDSQDQNVNFISTNYGATKVGIIQGKIVSYI